MNSVKELLEDFRAGRPVILVDDEDRENEGDIILAADFISPEWVNFMARQARGLICLALSAEQIERLQLPQMVPEGQNRSSHQTAFTVSIEAAHGVTTGISAYDRATTIRVAADPQSGPRDVIAPGHIFPIRARSGGVLERAGHTEASVDLARLAGLNPAAVICEVMNEDGQMSRLADLEKFSQRFSIRLGSIADLVTYLRQQRPRREAPTRVESFEVHP